MSDYRIQGSGFVRAADGAFIPADEENAAYRDLLAWQETGGVPDPEPVPPTPVREATYERLYSAMDALGVRAAWDAAYGATKPIYRSYFDGHYAVAIPEDSSKLAKVAGAAQPAISIKAVFDQVDHLTA